MMSIVLLSLVPEFFLSLSILMFLITNVYIVNSLKLNFPILKKELFSQVFLILLFASFLFLFVKVEGSCSNSLFFVDSSSINLKLFWMFFCTFSFVLIWRSFLIQQLNFFEFFVLFLLSVLSSLLLLSSSDLLIIYLIIELQSICFYSLASFKRGSSYSSEAGLKYFISSALMSCIFLFGCSMIYGALGTLNFNAVSLLLSFPLVNSSLYLQNYIVIGSLLIVIFFLFKLSIAPFHFWFPQVYDGSPLSSTIIFSLLPKFIIFSLLVKWLVTISSVSIILQPFLLGFGVFSSLFGIFLALRQKKLKKLFIYSSIGQLGLPLCSLSLMNLNSVVYSYFFFLIYMLTSVLLWSSFLFLYSSQKRSSKVTSTVLYVSSLSNLFYFNKIWAFSILIIFFSMCGVPPLSGFIAKFWIYVSLIESNYFLVAVFLILLGGFSAFYYLKVLKVSFFENKALVVVRGENNSLFKKTYFNLDCFINALFLFLLCFLTFYPDFLFFYLNTVVSVFI